MNKLFTSAVLAASAIASPALAACSSTKVIDVDVAIVGGGAAGVYAAARLLDHNKTVVILEKETQIGGQTATYLDPVTGQPINVGVKIFTNTTNVERFLRRFDFPMGTLDVGQTLGTGTKYVNFATGQSIPNITTPAALAQAAALKQYAAQLAKYPYLKFGYNLPTPVPEDLTLPFGQFMQKYNLSALANTFFDFCSGFVPLLEVPTLYMLKYIDEYELQALTQQNFIVAANGDTGTLYRNAAKFLGSRVLYGVDGMRIQRPAAANGTIAISVGNSTTGAHVVRARKLIMAIPPTLESLQSTGIDLGADEASDFGKLVNGIFYSLVVKDAGVDKRTNVRNRDPANLYSYPDAPLLYSVLPLPNTTSLYQIYMAAERELSKPEFDTLLTSNLARLPAAVRPANATAAQPRVVYTAAHTWNVRASVEDIKGGVYGRLEALQGQKSTWYIGHAWTTMSTTTIWEALEQEFLPKFLPTL